MKEVFSIAAYRTADTLPGRVAQRHVAPEDEVILLGQREHRTAQRVVGLEPKAPKRHVVVDDRARRGVDSRVAESPLHFGHPGRLEHRVGVDATDDLTRGGVQTHIARRHQALFLELPQVQQGCSRMLSLQVRDNLGRAVGRAVVDHDDLVCRDRLGEGGQDARANRELFVEGGDHDRDRGRRVGRERLWFCFCRSTRVSTRVSTRFSTRLPGGPGYGHSVALSRATVTLPPLVG